MKTSRITFARESKENGESLIHGYIFGGRYGPTRVPRGIEPAQVSAFIVAHIKRDTDYLAWSKALDAARFYETAPVAAHYRSLFDKHNVNDGIGITATAARTVADIGTNEDAQWAADFFDTTVVPKASPETYSIAIHTLPVLAPKGTADKLVARIAADVKAKSHEKDQGENQMRDFQNVQAIEKNELPGALIVVDAKTKLAAKPAADRRPELVRIYLKMTPITGEYIETWSARMLRIEAMDVDRDPVCAEFVAAMDEAIKKRGLEKCAFIITRAVQAIIYLQGNPDVKHKKLYDEAKDGSQNFLWDDPRP